LEIKPEDMTLLLVELTW